ncbi:PAAR domain-containing protein [Paenibacillus tuaregi]|uniref:hypothetical protein n=1 Tax=Paenibacillus tuaregi TaxID=1816681 RepID=UPI000838B3D8|nr:hypothetical protein [Paenibacillus tuaregi]
MAKIALNGAKTVDSIKSGYVTYERWRYFGGDTDSEGNPIPPAWVWDGTERTNALIKGQGVQASSKLYVNGVSAAVVGDLIPEQWVASPPVPSNSYDVQYRDISPGTSGSGNGEITTGNSSKVYLNGKLIAVQGSSVKTCLGNMTTLADGQALVNM